ncbi:MAG: cupin domain-containing protein [Candidatus Binataceae bacterium]
MANRTSLSQQLDMAVEAMMSSPDSKDVKLDPKVAALMRIAADLRGLPRQEFKARLMRELAAKAHAPALTPPITQDFTEARIYAILDDIAHRPPLFPHDIGAALAGLPDSSMRFLEGVNHTTLVASYARTPTHWERHPGGNEMLYIVDGAAEIVTLTDAGPVTSFADKGSIVICPAGLWHRQIPRPFVSELSLTPGAGTEGSDLSDPRDAGAGPMSPDAARVAPPSAAGIPAIPSYDVSAAAARAVPLAITEATTAQEADAAYLHVTDLDALSLGVMRFSGRTPWERHPDGDELLYALDGEVELTALTGDGPITRTIRAGDAFVCPRGIWHRQIPKPWATILFGTPNKTTEISNADDPRAGN